MKTIILRLLLVLISTSIFITSCTSTKELSYLNNLQEPTKEESFAMEVPDYKIQPRDILYITLKAMMPDGTINDFLIGRQAAGGAYNIQGESGPYLFGYDVNKDGSITLPVVGSIKVSDKTLEEIRKLLQEEFNKSYKNATVECKLLSFKFTVIGEVKVPGTYVNYNNFLTVFEAIGRAGGISEFGKRNMLLVIRTDGKKTRTFKLNLQDKSILSSEAYFLLPNDIVIVEPQKNKIFSMNLPTISFITVSFMSAVTTTLLMINYFNTH
jgi:polysaccharide export outer membrane protein